MPRSPGDAADRGDGRLIGQRARAFDFLFDAVVVTDLDGVVIDWNAGAERLYGYQREEILGRPVSVLHAVEDVDRITAEVFAALTRDGHWSGEIRRRAPDGSIGWIESVVVPLTDDAGDVVGAIGINRDITGRKVAEESLRDSEERCRTLAESSPNGVIVCDADRVVVSVNARAEAIFGYSREEMVGRPLALLVPEVECLVPAGGEQPSAAPAGEAARGSRALLSGRRKDGATVPLEVGVSAVATASGRWLMLIAHDLSESERVGERLRLLSAAVEAAANGVAISDANGVCQWVNPGFTAITGYQPEEIVGRNLSVLKSGVHDDAFFRRLWETITAGDPWHGEITNRHRDGHLYVEEQTITPVRDATGAITNYIAIKQDITERRRMEDELRRANERLTAQLAEIEALQAKLREQAVRDPLTSLYNRRFLAEALPRELGRARREGRPVALAILDIDRFKTVNDTFGHQAGDAVLQNLAELLRAHTRVSDVACRWGGEEFLVVMPGANLADAVLRAEEWRTRFAAGVPVAGLGLPELTLSVGVACFPEHGDEGEALLHAADEALYRAKNAGRNRVEVHGNG